jgi:hypothetical protein
MTVGYIYKIQLPNGKHYIGLTTRSIEQRTKEHKSCAKGGDTRILYNALRKYGMVDSLELIEIDTAATMGDLCEKEIGYIQSYKSYYVDGYGYNMTRGGEGTNGYVFTEDDNKKNSERTKKYYEDNPNARKEHGAKMKKYYEENPFAIQKMREIKNKYYEDNPNAGNELSLIIKKYYEDNPEARQHLSEIRKKYFEDNPEAKQQQYDVIKKYYEDNPEARREIRIKYFEENPEAGKEHSDRMKKYYEENPETRNEHGAKMKKYYEENPEARRRMSEIKGKNKPFDIFTTDGTFIKTFDNNYDAKDYLKTEHHVMSTIKICAVLAGKRNSSAGFVFKYKTI